MIVPNKDQIGLALLHFDLSSDERLAELAVDLRAALSPTTATTEMIFGYILGLLAADIGQNPQG